jgi:hypothetical protein
MSYSPVIIRPAQKSDIDFIWHLLHSDCKAWSEEMMSKELPDLFVLTYQERIISVFHGVITPGRIEEFWITTHPFYMNNSIRLAMENLMLSVLSYQLLNSE